jgi:hypothetical protein
MGARMMHPSSGRDNFNEVSVKSTSANSGGQPTAATNHNQESTQSAYKTEIKKKTKDAIRSAAKSSSETSSDNSTTTTKN